MRWSPDFPTILSVILALFCHLMAPMQGTDDDVTSGKWSPQCPFALRNLTSLPDWPGACPGNSPQFAEGEDVQYNCFSTSTW